RISRSRCAARTWWCHECGATRRLVDRELHRLGCGRTLSAHEHAGARRRDLVAESRGGVRGPDRRHINAAARRSTLMTSTTTTALRGPTPLGGFNLTALRLEITRVLRNRRTLFFIIVFPSLFFFMFRSAGGRNARAQADMIAAYVMISMAVYGAMVGTTSGGA